MSPLGRFCCGSRQRRIGATAPFVESRALTRWPLTFYATSTLRDAQNPGRWRSGDQRREPSQVLSDGGQNELILGASGTTQSQSTKPQDALQVCKPHL